MVIFLSNKCEFVCINFEKERINLLYKFNYDISDCPVTYSYAI